MTDNKEQEREMIEQLTNQQAYKQNSVHKISWIYTLKYHLIILSLNSIYVIII